MVFSSLEFLFRFIPIFFLAYFLVKPKYRNIVILVASLAFYAYGEPIYILLMLTSILVNHIFARQITIDRAKTELYKDSGKDIDTRAHSKLMLILAMVFNFGMLFVFKYLNFFIGIINGIAKSNIISEVALTLPLGISFYTFQMASYVIDVYRGEYYSKKNILDFATYVSMFPQLIAGPIVNYKEVAPDMNNRKTNFSNIESGAMIFILGFVYKVLLANKISSLWNDVQTIGPYGINTATAWLGSWGYSMQIYFDFFGYSLMAIGLGKIMGFKFPDNFNNPYCSRSASDFWRRWHITLGRWFREYIYIPLGGNRKGVVRLVINTFVVWFLTGLWHGANWNFIIWGLLFFVLLMFEKLVLKNKFDKSDNIVWKIVSRIYMLVLIPFSWTIFNITDLKLLGTYLKRMFFIPIEGSVIFNGKEKFFQLFGNYWWLLLICAFCCTPIPLKLVKRFKKNWICKIILLGLFWFAVIQLAKGGSNPFLYFRF